MIPDNVFLSEQWKRLNTASRCVFLVMQTRCGEHALETEWNHTDIARETGLTTRTVKESINELRRASFIRTSKWGGRWLKAIYILNPQYLEPPPIEGDLVLPIGGGKVYFIGNTDNYIVKIGFSQAGVYDRLKDLQTGCPYRLSILKTVEGTNIEGEKLLQQKFGQYRLNGEWFSIVGALRDYLGIRRR